MKALSWFTDRARERSTWVGLSVIVSALGVSISPELQDSIITAGVSVGGLVAIVTKDKAP